MMQMKETDQDNEKLGQKKEKSGKGKRHIGRKVFCGILLLMVLYIAGTFIRVRIQTREAEERIAQDQRIEHETAIVYFTTDISSEGMLELYHALGFEPEGNVGIKLSTGEAGGSYYLSPELIKGVVEEVNGTIIESNTAYGGSRSSTDMHIQTAKDHGFYDIADVVILDAEGSIDLPVEDGIFLNHDRVGEAFEDFDTVIVLTHFKGHAIAGFGGAIKNISIGIASSGGKNYIHNGGLYHMANTWMLGAMARPQENFLASMGEAGKAVSDSLNSGENIIYINVLNNISIDCDCDSNPSRPDIHDIGIVASTDPVAIDQACIDLVYAAEGNTSLVQRIESRNGLYVLDYAQAIGLGSKVYELITID